MREITRIKRVPCNECAGSGWWHWGGEGYLSSKCLFCHGTGKEEIHTKRMVDDSEDKESDIVNNEP